MYARLLSATTLCITLASCGGGGGSSSPAVPPPPPAAPTGVSATAGDGYVLLDGNPVAGASAYTLYWSTSSGVSPSTGTKLEVSSTPQAHTGLTNGQTYYYVVTASSANGESAASAQVSATPAPAAATADPLLADQWHLVNASQPGATGTLAKAGEDINVQPVWNAGIKGAGVHIAIVDEGLEVGHEDLISNVGANGSSHNYATGSSDPTNDPADTTPGNGHGTACAGIAAARDLNGFGGSGVAPRATLLGYNMLQNSTASNMADAMSRNAASVGVSSNSWGSPDGTGNLEPASTLWRTAIDAGITTGRGGKGTVYLWAAGNGNGGSATCPQCSDNSNYDGLANYHNVIAVGAVNDQGVQSSYSESGANVVIAAPGGEFCSTHTITTTDRSGTVGINTAATASDYANANYTRCMNGTSAATPTVSGVVALMLEANPSLTWRDVRIILALTARINDPADAGWTGGVTAPFFYNHKYGFGVINATGAVGYAALPWVNVPPEVTYAPPSLSPALAVPDNNATGISSTLTVAGSGITKIEYVEITFSAADHTYSGDLDIKLTSPSGAVSQLSVPHVCAGTPSTCTSHNAWVFGSARHLYEAADGNWTLTVKDMGPNDVGTLQSWGLKFYGH